MFCHKVVIKCYYLLDPLKLEGIMGDQMEGKIFFVHWAVAFRFIPPPLMCVPVCHIRTWESMYDMTYIKQHIKLSWVVLLLLTHAGFMIGLTKLVKGVPGDQCIGSSPSFAFCPGGDELKKDHPSRASCSHKPDLMYTGQRYYASTALNAISYCHQKHYLGHISSIGQWAVKSATYGCLLCRAAYWYQWHLESENIVIAT